MVGRCRCGDRFRHDDQICDGVFVGGGCRRGASDACPAIPEESMVVVRGGCGLTNHAAQYRLADPSSSYFTRVAEECSRTRHWLGLDGLLSAESALEMRQPCHSAAVVRRAVVLVRSAGRQALPHAGLDVCYSALGVVHRKRARLLPGPGLPHAPCGRSGLGRAVAEFAQRTFRFDRATNHLRTLAVAGLTTAAVTLPIAPLNSAWWRVADNMNGGNFNMQIGWPELVETVAKIRDSLPAQDRARLGVLAGDEGETGAVNLYGPAYGLPSAISGMNSNWLRGYGDPPPQTLIVLGEHRDFVERNFES